MVRNPQCRVPGTEGAASGPEAPDLPPSHFLHSCFSLVAPRLSEEEATAVRDSIDDVLGSISQFCTQRGKTPSDEALRAWVFGYLVELAAFDQEATAYPPFNGSA